MKTKAFIIFAIIIWAYFFLVALRSLVFGGIPFWYDPARDLLLAWDNLNKISLIGQPAGIPGVFYGPYWIWLNSAALLLSKDPRAASFLVLTAPYFIGVPLLLASFRKSLGWTALLLFMLFFAGFGEYATSIWNPHLAPLIILTIALLVYKAEFSGKGVGRNVLIAFATGVLGSLLISFHLSLAMAVIPALGVFWLLGLFRNFTKNNIYLLAAFIGGVFIALFPTIMFEARHGFNISRSFLNAFVNSAVYNSAVVGQTGLEKTRVIAQFWDIQSKFLRLPGNLVFFIWPVIVGYLYIFRKLKFSLQEKQLIGFLLFVLSVLAFIYISSKNPVWSYHFIGAETILILFLALFTSRSRFLTVIFLTWTVVFTSFDFWSFIHEIPPKYHLVSGLSSKEKIVAEIYKDTTGKEFKYYAYNPAIYSFDYDYLFRWKAIEYKNTPQKSTEGGKTTYLIIPETSVPIAEDFIHYRTPDPDFITEWEKVMPDKTRIIKRVPKLKV